MNQILIDQTQKNQTFDVSVSDTIIITLKENPTTGYRWKLDHGNEEIIKMEDSKYSMTSANGIGGGGTRTFTFKALSLGKTNVQLSLKREWEKKLTGFDQFKVFIMVI
jgi:inhibitor of cysteine peptidase